LEGGDDDSLDGETEHNLAPQVVRLFFRRDQRCEIDLPHAVDTLNFIYVDIDLSFVRTGSTQYRKYEPLLLKKMHVSHRDVHDKEVQAQILREIVQRDSDLGKLNSQQVVLTLKKDKTIRRRVLKIAGVRLGGLMNLSKALKGLGIEMSAKELENEEADEYKDSPEYKFIKGHQYDRDRIIDQLMMQQASLSTIKEKLEYEVLSKQIEQNTLKREDLTEYQKGIMAQIEERNEERLREQKFAAEQAAKKYAAWLEQNLEDEFDQYSFVFLH